jgi:signal peptidase I
MLRRLAAFFFDVLEVVVLAIALFLFTYLLAFQPHKIDGASMEPNFHDQEYLLTDKINYKILKKPPRRGEVVVFKPPNERDKEYIKRIIGLPGEKVSVREGHVYINGELLEESYIDRQTKGAVFLPEGGEVTVPPDYYFVLGDNRTNSSDSRYFGFIPKSDIVGRAWLLYWPIGRAGLVEKVSYSL